MIALILISWLCTLFSTCEATVSSDLLQLDMLFSRHVQKYRRPSTGEPFPVAVVVRNAHIDWPFTWLVTWRIRKELGDPKFKWSEFDKNIDSVEFYKTPKHDKSQASDIPSSPWLLTYNVRGLDQFNGTNFELFIKLLIIDDCKDSSDIMEYKIFSNNVSDTILFTFSDHGTIPSVDLNLCPQPVGAYAANKSGVDISPVECSGNLSDVYIGRGRTWPNATLHVCPNPSAASRLCFGSIAPWRAMILTVLMIFVLV
ncbi:hypothetical protein QBC35DRAFT_474181 [Podospora australis]|uniref:Uncharacterized protein n=1 Tax=Podospora australis TaxID=1536484 RepID=A0AAN6WTC0_9PEZI|nr:hypothetical protein QBC35DRAFT_474181 [Podospora australis]